jgi:acyl carrier protein
MKTAQEDIKETVKNFIVEHFLKNEDAEHLTYDTPLISGGIIDSILTMRLVVFIENTYNFEFSSHEVDRDNLNSINIIANFIEKKLDGKS